MTTVGGRSRHPGRDRLCAEILVAAEDADPDELDAATTLEHGVDSWIRTHKATDDQAVLGEARRYFGDDAVFACLFMDCLQYAELDSWSKYAEHVRGRMHRVDMILAGFRRFGIDTLPGAERCRSALEAVRGNPADDALSSTPLVSRRLCAAFELWVRQRFVDEARTVDQRTRLPASAGLHLVMLAADLRRGLGRDPTVEEFAARLGCAPDSALQQTLADLTSGTFALASPLPQRRRRSRTEPAARPARPPRSGSRRR